jgi:DNA-binding NarL/FixJ family response regulator
VELRSQFYGATSAKACVHAALHKLAVSFTDFQTFVRLASSYRWSIEGEKTMKTVLRRKPDALIEEPADLDLLTPRQRDILRLVSIGHTNREIANMLQISVRTVEVHRFNLMRRLNVRNVAQLLRRALQLGLLSKSFGK